MNIYAKGHVDNVTETAAKSFRNLAAYPVIQASIALYGDPGQK